RRAARELECCPAVGGEIRRGLVAPPVENAKASLRVHDAQDRSLQSRARDRAGAHRVCDQAMTLELGGLVETEEQIVSARLERAQSRCGFANALERTH